MVGFWCPCIETVRLGAAFCAPTLLAICCGWTQQ